MTEKNWELFWDEMQQLCNKWHVLVKQTGQQGDISEYILLSLSVVVFTIQYLKYMLPYISDQESSC